MSTNGRVSAWTKNGKNFKNCKLLVIVRYVNNKQIFRMDTENLHLAIMSEEKWGDKLSENDSFYRLLFKLDKIRENNGTLKTERCCLNGKKEKLDTPEVLTNLILL